MSRAHTTALRALIGLALLAALLWLAQPQALWATLRGADWRWLALGLGLAVASNVLSAWRWRLLVRFLGGDAPFRDALRWYFQAIGLNSLLPGAVVGGDVYRAFTLRRQGVPTDTATLSVLFDRISGLWMLCGLSALGLAWLALPFGAPWLLRRLPQGPSLQAGRAAQWIGTLRQLAARPDFTGQLWAQVAASAGVQLLSAAALACAAVSFGVWLPWFVWAYAMAPIFLMAAMPVSVGGWGTREAACVATLAPFGVAAPAAIGVGLVYGLYGLAQGALGALAFGLPAPSARS